MIKYALHNLGQRKLRSVLTILSILIGVMAAFALLSFGLGLKSYIDNIAEELGQDKIIIQGKGFGPPGSLATQFTESENRFVERLKVVKETAPIYIGTAEVTFKRDKRPKYPFVAGYDIDKEKLFYEGFTLKLQEGRSLRKGDKFKATVGYNYLVADKVFDEPLKLRDKLILNGIEVEVVGFHETLGNDQDDSNIYVPEDAANEILNRDGLYDMIIVRVHDSSKTSESAEEISERLRRERNQDPGKEDFDVQTFEQVLASFNAVFDVMNWILIGIALISAVVAVVNIANTMYTSTLERTKEIGVMKAIGARNGDILFVFVFEGAVLGLLGGIVGVLVGYGIASIGKIFVINAGLAIFAPIFPPILTIVCISSAVIIAALASLFPAFQASLQNPVEALRYE